MVKRKKENERTTLLLLLVFNIVFWSNGLGQKKEIIYLSGKDNNSNVRWDFYCTGGRQSGYWTTIQVPGCWEQQGFGNYNYGRDYKTNGKNFRFSDEQGVYRFNFSVPDRWKGNDVFLAFEGSMTDTEVKINGMLAGDIHQGAFYQFRYNITDKIVVNKPNLLEVTVSKMSSNASVNNAERLADYWIFGGIFRPVYLEALPHERVQNVAIDARANGFFRARCKLANITHATNLAADILDGQGKTISTINLPLHPNDSVVVLQTTVKNVQSWSSEFPTLYTVNLKLKKDKTNLYTQSQKFGFRTIEVKHGDGIYVNGVQVKMKGVNRHSWWPETGRTLNDNILLNDVKLIREMNMNAVRCSHYPPDQRFLDFCDSLGLYVIDELAGWQKAYDTKAGEKLVKEMVLRDVNHPSILFWANGNEGGTNKELDDDFTTWDFSHRPVIHPHHRPGNDFNGIDCNHYEDYNSTQKILADSLIYMPTEFLHAQDDGGAGCAMRDFWELHWHSKRSGGGFLWALLDEGIVRTDMNNVIDTNGLNANDGILGPHREKEGSFFALREIFCPVHVSQQEISESFKGDVAIENRFHFTNLNACEFRWALVNFRKPFESQSGYVVKKKGTAMAPNIPPAAKGSIHLALPMDYRQYDALIVAVNDNRHEEIGRWSWKLKSSQQMAEELIPKGDSAIAASETDSTFLLAAAGITVALYKKTGTLLQVKNLSSGYNLSFNNGPIFTQGMSDVVHSKLSNDDNEASASFTYTGPLKSAIWKITGNGWVSLTYSYELRGAVPFAGISFSYPENYVFGAKWLGKGPYRQWKNRPEGTPVNVWQNLYNNTQTGYSPWVYPEFKGYYGDVSWLELLTAEGKLYIVSKDAGLYVRLFDFYGLTGIKPFPALPPGNISFLDCIPPMGTKLATNLNTNTASLGPQSEQTNLSMPVTRTLFFYFGTPPLESKKEQYSRPDVDEVF